MLKSSARSISFWILFIGGLQYHCNIQCAVSAFAPRSKTYRSAGAQKKGVVSTSSGSRSPPKPIVTLSSSSPMEGGVEDSSNEKKKSGLMSAIQNLKTFLGQGEWKEKLLKASNFASLLCVVDCTVLPFVTVVLPIFGIIAGSPAQMEYLHELGHKIALFFVLPVGGTATTMNYMYSHKKKRIAAIGATGLLMVLMANSGASCAGHHHHHHHHHHVTSAFGKIMHAVQHGALHRIVNISGCALLLGSNYLSRREGCGACAHDHGHNHSHDHHHHD